MDNDEDNSHRSLQQPSRGFAGNFPCYTVADAEYERAFYEAAQAAIPDQSDRASLDAELARVTEEVRAVLTPYVQAQQQPHYPSRPPAPAPSDQGRPITKRSDASGDTSSSGNGSDPTTPAGVSGAEDTNGGLITGSNDSLDQIVGKGAASGQDNMPDTKWKDVAAQLANVSPIWEPVLGMPANTSTLQHLDNLPTLQLQDPHPEMTYPGILPDLNKPDSLLQPGEERYRYSLNYQTGEDAEQQNVHNGLNDFASYMPSMFQEQAGARTTRSPENNLRYRQNKLVRPIVSNADTFFPPANGLSHNMPLNSLTTDDANMGEWNTFSTGDFTMPVTSSYLAPDMDGQAQSYQYPSYPGSKLQAYQTSSNAAPQYQTSSPPGRFQPDAQTGGFTQGAEYQQAHGNPGSQTMGGMPEGAGGLGEPGTSMQPMPSRSGKPTYTVCVDVHTSEHVAEIVGRQGCKIKELRARTQTYIRTPTREEPPIFTVTGVKEKVELAAKEIRQMADHFTGIRDSRRPRQANPNEVSVQIPINTKLVGLVVGTKGVTVKKIQEDSGAYIVTPSRETNGETMSLFLVKGQPHEVRKAERMIKEHISARLPPPETKDANNNANGHAKDPSCRSPNRMVPGSKPPSPDLCLSGASGQQGQRSNGFASGNPEPPMPQVNGRGSVNGFGPEAGFSSHNGTRSWNTRNGSSGPVTNGFGNDHSGNQGADRHNGPFMPNGSSNSFGSNGVNSSSQYSNGINSSMSNAFGSNSMNSGFNGSAGSVMGNTSLNSSSSAGFSNTMTSRYNGSSSRPMDRWNGASASVADQRNNSALAGFMEKRRNTPMNGWSSGINERSNGFSQGINGQFHNGLSNGMGASYSSQGNGGFGQGAVNGISNDLNQGRSNSVNYNSPQFASNSMNGATSSQFNFSMAPGSGRNGPDSFTDDRSMFSGTNSRVFGRSTGMPEGFLDILSSPSDFVSNFAGDMQTASPGIEAFGSSTLDCTLPPFTSYGPTGLATTSSLNAEPSVAMSSAFSGSLLAGNPLMGLSSDPWANSTGQPFPEVPLPKQLLEENMAVNFRDVLKFSDEMELPNPQSEEKSHPEESGSSQEADKEAKQEKQEKDDDGKAQEEQKEPSS